MRVLRYEFAQLKLSVDRALITPTYGNVCDVLHKIHEYDFDVGSFCNIALIRLLFYAES